MPERLAPPTWREVALLKAPFWVMPEELAKPFCTATAVLVEPRCEIEDELMPPLWTTTAVLPARATDDRVRVARPARARVRSDMGVSPVGRGLGWWWVPDAHGFTPPAGGV